MEKEIEEKSVAIFVMMGVMLISSGNLLILLQRKENRHKQAVLVHFVSAT